MEKKCLLVHLRMVQAGDRLLGHPLSGLRGLTEEEETEIDSLSGHSLPGWGGLEEEAEAVFGAADMTWCIFGGFLSSLRGWSRNTPRFSISTSGFFERVMDFRVTHLGED
jgi:hypothetical protein